MKERKNWGKLAGLVLHGLIGGLLMKRYTSPTRPTVRPCWGDRIIGFIRLVSSIFCGQCLH
jgi:hypothetical protein